MAKLKAGLDERFAALEKRLEAERAGAGQEKPAAPTEPKRPEADAREASAGGAGN